MVRFSKMRRKDGPPPTFLCRNRAEVTRALTAIRGYLGISQLELDDIAGFNSGYTSKLECAGAPPPHPGGCPSGRFALHPMFVLWLGALKCAVLVVPIGEELDIAAAVAVPAASAKVTYRTAEKIRAHRAETGASIDALAIRFRTDRKLVIAILAGTAFSAPEGLPSAA